MNQADPFDVLFNTFRFPAVPLTVKLVTVVVAPAVNLIKEGGVVMVMVVNVFEP